MMGNPTSVSPINNFRGDKIMLHLSSKLQSLVLGDRNALPVGFRLDAKGPSSSDNLSVDGSVKLLHPGWDSEETQKIIF